MHYRPLVAFVSHIGTGIADDWDTLTNMVNDRIEELSQRHIIEDVQFDTNQHVACVMIRYRADQWAPKEDQ